MLVLTRRIKESLKISDDIEVTVLQIRGNQVRIGITAPPHIFIHREEVYRKVNIRRFTKPHQATLMKNTSYFSTFKIKKGNRKR